MDSRQLFPKEEFLQSSEYGDFLRQAGREVCHNGLWQGTVNALPLGWKYLYFPRVAISALLLEEGKKITKEKKAVFIRIEPVHEFDWSEIAHRFVENRQPQSTWILNLHVSESDLLGRMHEKTRYNIRLAEKKGVRIEQKKDSQLFWRLNTIMLRRQRIRSNPLSYFEILLQSPAITQINAYVGENAVATTLLYRFQDRLYYLHGASSDEYRNYMAPYVLQWHSILFAKAQNCSVYDFWGIAPPASSTTPKNMVECFHGYCWDKQHRLAGVTRFKAGFGGEVLSYPEAVEVVLDTKKYFVYEMARKLKVIH